MTVELSATQHAVALSSPRSTRSTRQPLRLVSQPMDNAQPKAHASSDAGRYPLSRRPSFEVAAALVGLILVSLLAFLAVQRLNPPAAADADAPPTEFSAARAMEHVTSLSASPRPIGSSA